MFNYFLQLLISPAHQRTCGVMVKTQPSESSCPRSSLGGGLFNYFRVPLMSLIILVYLGNDAFVQSHDVMVNTLDFESSDRSSYLGATLYSYFYIIVILLIISVYLGEIVLMRSHGVMVNFLDFEYSDPSSNIGGTLFIYFYINYSNFINQFGTSRGNCSRVVLWYNDENSGL